MIKTDRLTLRTARSDDLTDFFVIYGDRRAMRYWSTPPHEGKSTTKGGLDRQIRAAGQALTYFAIEMDGHVIGNAGNYRGTEIGFIMHPDYWRQGIIKEAMQAIIPSLSETTDLPVLTADVDPRNEASVALLKALGFDETHRAKNTFCIEGEWSDSIYFALPRPGEPR